MKQIMKSDPANDFISWNKNNANVSWEEFVKSDVYQSLRRYLRNEQNELCCYCELYIEEERNAHIEHFKPRSKYPKDTYNYQNLHACCQETDSCGHKKGGRDIQELISPLTNDCENRFTYTGDGRIIPLDKNDSVAAKTIEVLGLNCIRLKDRRKSIIKTLEHADASYIEDSLKNYKEWLCGFYTVIEYISNR